MSGALPGRRISLEAYSQPDTTYTSVRPPRASSADGTLQFRINPGTSTRYRVRVEGCADPSASRVLLVRPVLSLQVTRTASRRYTFSGRILPARQNVGRAITLYYTSGGTRVRRDVARVGADGTYRSEVRFTGSGRFEFVYATGANRVNTAATSNTRSVLVY